MNSLPAAVMGKRKFWLCVILVFLGGFTCGVFVGISGFRHFLLHRRPPSAETVAKEVSGKIQREYQLDEAARAGVEHEILLLGRFIHDSVTRTHDRIEAEKQARIENIAAILPDGSSRERWRKDYPRFIRKPPPPPAPK